MKQTSIVAFAVVGFAALLTACASATPIGSSNVSREYLVADRALSHWSFGLSGSERQMIVKLKKFNDWPVTVDTSKIMGYIGYDVADIVTLFLIGGVNDTEPADWGSGESDSQSEYGAGFQIGLLDRILPDPFLFEDRIRLLAGATYTMTEADLLATDWKWSELTAYLTLYLVNDVEGNKAFLPEGIAVFGGPVYTKMLGSDIKNDNSDAFGFNLGLEFYFSECISFDLGVLQFEDRGYTAGLHVRF